MNTNFNSTVKLFLLAWIGLGLLVIEPMAQRKKRGQEQSKIGQEDSRPLVRAFSSRSKSGTGSSHVESVQINSDQLGLILRDNPRNGYASLSAFTTYVAGRAYLIFRTHGGLGATSEVNGSNGIAHFNRNRGSEVEIGVKPRAAGKAYLLDVHVKEDPSCTQCFFVISGPDGHTESWSSTNALEHLYFTVSTNDTGWYAVKLIGANYDFMSCVVHELP